MKPFKYIPFILLFIAINTINKPYQLGCSLSFVIHSSGIKFVFQYPNTCHAYEAQIMQK